MTPTRPVRRLAIATGGGDAPGLNAVIRATTLAARGRGWDVVGIRDGFDGLLHPDQYTDGVVTLDDQAVRGIGHLGGTILGTTNTGDPTRTQVTRPDGTVAYEDRAPELVRTFEAHGIDALVSVGGDGSLAIAHHLHATARAMDVPLRVVGVPKTIDNDLDRTTSTFGFDTAVSFATEAVDRLFSTASSHRRIMVVEVMGRYAGWIALHTGVAAGAHAVLLPEIPYDIERVADAVRRRYESGSKYAIVVVAEGAAPIDGHRTTVQRPGTSTARLGGVGEKVADELSERTGREARSVVLGHLLRGGTPTAVDRLLGLRFGAAAVRALDEGYDGVMVALAPPTVQYVPLESAIRRQKLVPLDSDTVLTARDLGICLGD